jgi:uncharacterized protein YprB with RNaseH-like and TPR domain
MARNLKARLERIRTIEPPRGNGKVELETAPKVETQSRENAATWPGWTDAGHMTIKREFCRSLPLKVPRRFPDALAVLLPDMACRDGRRQMMDLSANDELLFFDLETTGLSGGAGTIAFLAAFGRLMAPGEIKITQYLLLDYPGEPDFLENLAAEFSATVPPYMVSYNGKSFDSQIFRTRLLMNGIRPPEYRQADLLHPARRLWKRRLPDCSQATIEVEILGLDRTGDVSGALAPDIWFSFLRNGERGDLLSICEHNAKDIAGLGTMFLAIGEIAWDPIGSGEKYRVDEEGLALYWRNALKKRHVHLADDEAYRKLVKTGDFLLSSAAEKGCPRAAVVMAKNAEWRMCDIKLALRYTNMALENCDGMENLRDELIKRRARLERKL